MKVFPPMRGNWAATKATYNLWKSPRIKPDDIRFSQKKVNAGSVHTKRQS